MYRDRGMSRPRGRGAPGGYRDERRGGARLGRGGSFKNKQPGAQLCPQRWDNLPPFQKDFYTPHNNVSSRSQNDVMNFRSRYEMTIRGNNVPHPVEEFEEANFPPYVMDKIRRQGFLTPTPIQSQGWPIALSGNDMVGIAKTGSGKTLAVKLNIPARGSEEDQCC
uniref:RNA helicase n=1 Tax=Graphocephala atropunctata TaxID=36148 RepID=A0A1B6MBV2_9HEMI